MSRGTRAVIHLDALQHNFAQVRRAAPDSWILSVVKADAYGHGLVPVTQALSASDGFGVATFDEALALSKAGIQQPILLMEGVMSAAELRLAAEKQFQVVVHQNWQRDMLLSAQLPQPLTVWLKVNTGMNRLGVPTAESTSYWQALQASTNVKQLVLMSHLACADQSDHDLNARQGQVFSALVADVKSTVSSLANSAGILHRRDFQYQWVRPGLMLYGASPLQGASAADLQLRPVMQLESRIIAKSRVLKGDSIGYGATWTAPKDTDVAVVAIGYGDGYPRHLCNQAYVLVNGVRCPLVGRVSMDMITVDVSAVPECGPETPVILWGNGLPVEAVAAWAGTVNYELLCQVTGRVTRTYCTDAV